MNLFTDYFLWTAAGIVLLILEMLLPGFVLACFGLGAFGSAIAAYMDASNAWQIIIFAATSLVALVAVRPVVEKCSKEETPTNTNALIGQTGLVTESIDNANNEGRVKLRGELWKAKSSDNSTIPANEEITVTQIEGASVIVERRM